MGHSLSKTDKDKASVTSPVADGLISGPKLRRFLDVSAVTLWRRRNDEKAGFPKATVINGRLYFLWDEVLAWLAKQRRAA